MIYKNRTDGPRILIVDDEEGFCEELRDLLTANGFLAEYTVKPLECVDKISGDREHQWVVIIDAVMPSIDGITLSSILRDNIPAKNNLQIIMITGRATTELAIEALRSNVNDFIQKPIQPEEVVRRVRQAIKRLYSEQAPNSIGELNPLVEGAESHKHSKNIITALNRVMSTKRKYFSGEIDDDATFRIVLELYQLNQRGESTPVTNLYYLSELPLSTALRRVENLIKMGIAEKFKDVSDGRRQMVRLTDYGVALIEKMLDEVGRH